MSNTVSPKPSRWRWAVLGLLVMGALSVPTGIVILQHRLQAQPHDTARPWDDPKISQKLADARLVKAKAIRAEWRDWAFQHKEGLKAMLDSQGKDFSKVQAVYKISPPMRSEDPHPDTTSGPTKFGWMADTEKQIANGSRIKWVDAASEAVFNANKGRAEAEIRKQFREKSDFQVAASLVPGPTETQLWASGRITERTFVKNPNRSSGQRAIIQLPYKELVPPYDFLTSANSG